VSAQFPLDLEQTVRREAPALLAYLGRRTADPADAADLLGDVLVVIWRRIDAMPPDVAAARMWMFGIARKVLAGGYRSARRRQALTDRLRQELSSQPDTADLNGSKTINVEDPRLERLTLALDQLKPSEREIVRLIHWDGFTLSEAAHHLHLRLSTTRSRYYRARDRLKQLLEQP
jgi:RNA polymerase sigma-70 factor (ECF subfamily)